MNSRSTLLRLRRALRRELRLHRGQIGDLEVRLGHRRGYLSRVLQGSRLNLGTFLGLSSLMAVDSAAFLAACFGGEPAPLPLPKVVELEGIPAVWRRIEGLLDHLERWGPVADLPVRGNPATGEDVDEFLACPSSDQRRRLRLTMRYRSVPFLEVLLRRLDGEVEQRPEKTWRLAEVLFAYVLPRLPAERQQALALACRILSLWAEARVARRCFDAASLAIQRGLALARSHGLKQEEAELLRCAARLLWRQDLPRRAMALLQRAQLIYYDLGRRTWLGQVLSERGAARLMLGDLRGAEHLLTQALGLLGGDGEAEREVRRWAVRLLVRTNQVRGDAAAARFWSAKIEARTAPPHASVWEESPGMGLSRQKSRAGVGPRSLPRPRRWRD